MKWLVNTSCLMLLALSACGRGPEKPADDKPDRKDPGPVAKGPDGAKDPDGKPPSKQGEEPTPTKDGAEELTPLQGLWTMESMISKGQGLVGDAVRGYELEIKGNTVIERFPGFSVKIVEAKGQLSVNNSTKPKQWDQKDMKSSAISVSVAPARVGVYELQGDVLKITYPFDQFDTRRPPALDPPKEFGFVIAVTYRRKGGQGSGQEPVIKSPPIDLAKEAELAAQARKHLGIKDDQTSIDLANKQVADIHLKAVFGMKSLKSLNVSFTNVTDIFLKDLTGLENLESLDLTGTKVSDAGMKELAGLKRLQFLGLFLAGISDEGLKHLAGLENLQSLGLQNTRVTDAGLKHLAGLKNLQFLGLDETAVTGAGLRELAGLKSLRKLNIPRAKVTDAGLKGVATLKNLQRLDVAGTPFGAQVTDAGLKELKGLTSLQYLGLDSTAVTDAGLKELTHLKSLETLSVLYNLNVSDALVEAFYKALPKCKVVRSPRL